MQALTHEALSLVVRDELDDEYFHLLKQKLRDYNRRIAPWMEPPDAVPLNIQLEDATGRVVGGMAALTYWNWLVIKLMVLDDAWRGNGIGRRLMQLAHEEARRRGCTRAQTATYDFQALDFYLKQGYRVVGCLEDYPEGCNYYWLRKELGEADVCSTHPSTTSTTRYPTGRNGLHLSASSDNGERKK